MLHFYATKYGELELENGRIIEVRAGNCLAVLIYKTHKEDGDYWNLYSVFGDTQHLKNCLKDGGDILFGEKPKRIKMNLAYKEAETLTRYLTKSGHIVECYYNKENTEK